MSTGLVNPGDILASKYRVDRLLGVGNMGMVVEATNLALDQKVALKFMLPNRNEQSGQHERFRREARIAVRLTTPHVTRVLDFGTLESGAPYIVMEFLKGRDLAAVLGEQGALPFDEAIEYVLQACEAVGEAHAAGIVHRDIKPANLFLATTAAGPCIKVLDFGISKVLDPKGELGITRDMQLLGSPLYMSPEHINSSKDVDSRADIWSLGVTLYELVAGRTPFDSRQVQELTTKVFFKPPTPLSQYRQDAPSGFEAVVLRCLEKEREKRYHTVAELAAALVPFAPRRVIHYAERVAMVTGAQPGRARTTDVLPAAPVDTRPQADAAFQGSAPIATSNAAPMSTQAAPSSRSKGGILVAAGVLLLAVAVGAYVLGRRSGEPAGNPVTSAGSGPTQAEPTAKPTIAAPPLTSTPLPVETAASPSATAPTSAAAHVPAAATQTALPGIEAPGRPVGKVHAPTPSLQKPPAGGRNPVPYGRRD